MIPVVSRFFGPWLFSSIGYFVDNELHGWGAIGKHVFTSPANDNAKVELIHFLKKKYSKIAQLNNTWETSYKSWEELLIATQNVKGRAASDDLLEFEKKELTATDALNLIKGRGRWDKKKIKQFFDICNLVNFAKYEANEKDFEKILQIGNRVVG